MAQLSVIMNCLNGAKYLPEALACLKAQTFQDFEIIFWDNGSTDASGQIAQGYGKQLRYFYSAETIPLGAARNLALAHASAPNIAFLDCDDLWLPEKLERQLPLMAGSVGLVYTDTEIFNGKRVLSRVFAQSPPSRGHAFAALALGQFISMSSAMVSRKALDACRDASTGQYFDETLNVCEEADLFYRIAHDFELDYVDAPLTLWRSHGASTTFRKFGQFASETRLILSKMRRLYPDFEQNYRALIKALERRADFQEAVSLWRDGQGGVARKLIQSQLGGSRKLQLFWLASFLPGSCFDLLGKLYFSLPKRLRGK